MQNKRNKNQDNNTDKTIAKAGKSKPERLKTDEPLSEKDEVKQAEDNMRKHLNKKK